MAYENETLEKVFGRTDGKCHLCHKKLSLRNYASSGARGAWEVEHSVPRAKGGTDHLNNLYAACIPCNRAKGIVTTRTARARNGVRCAPYSKNQRREHTWVGAAIGSLALGLLFPQLRLAAWLIGAGMGAAIGHRTESE